MLNLDEYVSTVEEITSEITNAPSRERLLDNWSRILEILEEYLGIERSSENELVENGDIVLDDETTDLSEYRSVVEEMGSNDPNDLTDTQIQQDLETMVSIFHRLHESTMTPVEEQLAEDEEIVENEEEIVV